MAQDPVGRVVRNLFLLQQLGNGLENESAAMLQDLFDDVAARIARENVADGKREATRLRRVDSVMDWTASEAAALFVLWRKTMRSLLGPIGKEQAAWAKGLLEESVGSIGVDIRPGAMGINRVKAILDTDLLRASDTAADTLAGWAATQEAATVRRLEKQLKLGALQNETLDQLVRRVRGRHTGRYRTVVRADGSRKRLGRFEGGVMQATTKDAEAIARTALNHVGNRAHMATYQENADVVQGVESVAVLDSRTTILCASLDGRVWELGDPDIDMPPRHFNCRSVMVPRIGWERLGLEPPPASTRASKGGQVSSSLQYQEWLRDQPKTVQDEVLGQRRAELFRAGKVGLRDLVRKDGRVIPVQDLDV